MPDSLENPLLTAFYATPQGRLKRAIMMLGRKSVGVTTSIDGDNLFLRIQDWLVPVSVIESGYAANNGNPWAAIRAFQAANAKAPPLPAPTPNPRPVNPRELKKS